MRSFLVACLALTGALSVAEKRSNIVLDHGYELFSDGRMFALDPLLPVETELDVSALDEGAERARVKLGNVIAEMMREPLCEAARMDPVEFGKS